MRSRPWRGDVIGRDSASGNDAKNLIDKTCDFADMSVPMKHGEHFAAKANRVNHVQNVIALDGIAFVVHPHSSNHIKALNRDRIREYYISERASPNAPVVMIQRESNSGVQKSIDGLVMKVNVRSRVGCGETK